MKNEEERMKVEKEERREKKVERRRKKVGIGKRIPESFCWRM